MAFGSRLQRRRPQKTVTINTKSISGGYSETAAYNSISATHEQRDAVELMTDGGAVIMVSDVFWLEPIDGELPSVNEGQVLVDDVTSVRYDIIQVTEYDYMDRVRLMTRRAR